MDAEGGGDKNLYSESKMKYTLKTFKLGIPATYLLKHAGCIDFDY